MATTAAPTTRPSPASAQKTPARAPAAAKRQKDACGLLDADHKAVKALFRKHESRSRSTTKDLIAQIRGMDAAQSKAVTPLAGLSVAL